MGRAGSLKPGETAEREIKFLNRVAALEGVTVGDPFALLELRKVGEGRVVAIL
jgi:hypothetical protein